MSLPPGFLEEIRDRVRLSGVVGRKLEWDRRKSNPAKGDYWACCPFHQEKSSSFHVDDRKGFYYCFGCQAKGDAISFLREIENLSFMEAVEALAAEAGLQMPAQDPRAAEREERKSGLREAMAAAAAFFRLQLRGAKGAEARAYLLRRGLDDAAAERHDIGWAPDMRTGLLDRLLEKGFDLKTLDEAGLVIIPDDGGKPYDRFRGRVMFPIRDARNRLIAFGGRSLDPNARAKYLNSPETTLFDKGRTLYNHGPAREAAAKAGALIVAEGYMDVIALVEAGFRHAVAPLGTAITEDQLRLLWSIADEPVVALDGDKAGLAAAMRLVDLALPLLEAGKALRFAVLPGGKDPDDLIRSEGPGAMRAALDGAVPMVDLLWRRETEGHVFDSPERRAGLDRRLRTLLARIADANLRGHWEAAIRERRAKLFGPAPAGGGRGGAMRGGPGRSGPGRGARRGEFFAPMVPLSAELKASALGATAGREAELRGREAALLLALLNHPALCSTRLHKIEDVEFACNDLETLRRALISAADALDGAPSPDEWAEAVGREAGAPALPVLNAAPLAPSCGFARRGAEAEEAARGFDEALARHRALAAAAREVAEAETELARAAGAALDDRLSEAARRRFRDAAPTLDGGEEDESDLALRLERAVEDRIWEKRRRRNG